jgi:hypothetical protein
VKEKNEQFFILFFCKESFYPVFSAKDVAMDLES